MKIILFAVLIFMFGFNACSEKPEELKDGEKVTDIIKDVKFTQGFSLTPLHPKTVLQGGGFDKTYVDTLDFGYEATNPVWHFAQWYSKYSLANIEPEKRKDGSIAYSNKGRTVGLYPDHSLLLEINASNEYDRPRENGEHWPHILIAQDFVGHEPCVGEVDQLNFTMEIKLVKCENRMDEEEFDSSKHTAQTPFYFKVMNNNKDSPDYKEKIWFGLPSFDYRNKQLRNKEGVMWDIGTSTYMYFTPEQTIWGDVNLHDGDWHKTEMDIKPLILRSLAAMKEKDVFVNTKPSDLIITGMNFGWEVPGTFDVAIRVKDITLQSVVKNIHKEKKSISLLTDRNFDKGFIQHGSIITRDTVDILTIQKGKMPVWHLAQWYSSFVLKKSDVEILPGEGYSIGNRVNSINKSKSVDGTPVLELSSSGHKEWVDEVRQPGDAWPHMLISQSIDNCPTLDQLDELHFKITTRVKNWQLYHEDFYNPKIHAARYRLNLIVRNTNKNSKGYNNYYWFVMTLFDNRHEFMPEIAIKDKGSEKKQASQKFIYSPEAENYLGRSLHELEWVQVQKDILPLIIEGLQKGMERGFISESDKMQDYSITRFNIGFELTAAVDIQVELKKLDIVAITNNSQVKL